MGSDKAAKMQGYPQGQEGTPGKKPYRKPRVLSMEMLEVVAATCDGGKAEFTGLDNCGTIGPIQS